MTTAELIEELRKFPPDMTVRYVGESGFQNTVDAVRAEHSDTGISRVVVVLT
jgi:hypothetical protein